MRSILAARDRRELAQPVALAAGEQYRHAAGAGRGGYGDQPELEVEPHHLLPVCSALGHGASPSWGRFAQVPVRQDATRGRRLSVMSMQTCFKESA